MKQIATNSLPASKKNKYPPGGGEFILLEVQIIDICKLASSWINGIRVARVNLYTVTDVILRRWILTGYRTINEAKPSRVSSGFMVRRPVKIHRQTGLYHVPPDLYSLNSLLIVTQTTIYHDSV